MLMGGIQRDFGCGKLERSRVPLDFETRLDDSVEGFNMSFVYERG